MEFKLRSPTFGEVLRHLFLSWLLAALFEYLLLPVSAKFLRGMAFFSVMSFSRLLLMTVLGAVALYLGSCLHDITKYERAAFPIIFGLLSISSLFYNKSIAFGVICLIVFVVLTVYSIWGYKFSKDFLQPIEKSHWSVPVLLAVLTLGMFVFLSLWSVLRYRSFSTPTFDFGIFAQMFHNMRTTGLPMTTVERDGLLSHFAVHVSPIYYLMLPFYCLFPDPATLQVLQVAVVCSSVIPLWLIGKQNGLSGLPRFLLCTLLLVLPAAGGGIYYDLHENCFLLPLVLWLMYAIDKRKPLLIGIFAFLTLMVKEDAAVYVAIAALYLIIRTALNYRRGLLNDLITGIIMLLSASLYFLLVTNYLATKGDGVMTGRYDNFMLNHDDSLFSVIVTILCCPMKLLFECVDPEKQTYIFQTILPLLALPLITRKFERYILLIPYILLNLMPDYPYQHEILFQYNFGSSAFLLYLTAVNLSDFRISWVRLTALVGAILVSAGFFSGTVLPKATSTLQIYGQYTKYYDRIRENLDAIPDDVSVAAGTFYVAYLSNRSELCDIKYSSIEKIMTMEYVAVNKNSSTDFKNHVSYENFSTILEANGYQVVNNHQSIIIFHKSPS